MPRWLSSKEYANDDGLEKAWPLHRLFELTAFMDFFNLVTVNDSFLLFVANACVAVGLLSNSDIAAPMPPPIRLFEYDWEGAVLTILS
jgi:hypothetical protein